MKYPKVLQILALATAITVAAPGIVIPAQASETMETPEEYAGRTGYILPAGYHYVMDGQYVVLDENGNPVLEADAVPEAPTEAPAEPAPTLPVESEGPAKPEEETPGTSAGSGAGGEQTGGAGTAGDESDKDDTGQPGGAGGSAEQPGKDDAGQPGGTGGSADKPDKDDAGQPGSTGGSADNSDKDDAGQSGGAGGSAEQPGKDDAGQLDSSEEPDNNDVNHTGEDGDGGSEGEETDAPKEPDISAEPGVSGPEETPEESETEEMPEESIAEEAQEEVQEDIPAMEEAEAVELAPGFEGVEEEPFYLTSAQFRAIHERIQYNVDVPIDGIPSFITQEMIVGALKAQDETGYPASVTIAQIIQESGYGKYGPGGEDGKGLSYLAFEYCNLFGIKGQGTAGSVSMKTSEMEADGSTYSTYAGFRSYHTYTECIEDRSKLLKEVYADLTENVTDANTFAMKVGRRWATDLNYGKHLITTMRRYDLYRLDDMTLGEFSEMMGEFANPCPGSSITSLFGKRNAPIAGASTYHKGLDLGTGAYNIPTYAAKEGTVIFAGEAGACGNLITIDHGDGLVTKYMHHAEIYVKEGDKVEKGQQIGLSGTTGHSTGNHLHFQVEEEGKAVDPLKYLQAGVEEAEKAKEAYTARVAEAVNEAREFRTLLIKQQVRKKLK